MRPDNLKRPFTQKEQKVLIQDRVWFVPPERHLTESFQFPGWEHPDFFGNSNPVRIEYCSGNGAWIASKAASEPHYNWVAVEKKFMRVRKIWSKIKNMKLNNLIVICGEGYETTARYIPSNSVGDVFINFPDPWPKTRHAKHRIIQPHFVSELARILKKDGSMTFVTDDGDYSDWMIDTMKGNDHFLSCYPSPFYQTDCEGYGTSYFDQMWREKGKVIRYHKYCLSFS